MRVYAVMAQDYDSYEPLALYTDHDEALARCREEADREAAKDTANNETHYERRLVWYAEQIEAFGADYVHPVTWVASTSSFGAQDEWNTKSLGEQLSIVKERGWHSVTVEPKDWDGRSGWGTSAGDSWYVYEYEVL